MKRLSRRTLLRGAGGVVLGLPLLEAMLSSKGTAQDGEIPRRIVFMFTGNGPNRERWWPSGGEEDFVLAPSMAPLEPFRSRLLIPDNIRMETAREARGDGGNGHDVGTGHCLTARGIVAGPSGVGEFGHLWDGTAGGISIDQHIAANLMGSEPFRSVELGARAQGIRQALPSRISYRGRGEPVTPFHTPGATFDALFGGFTGPIEEGPSAQDRRRALVLGGVSDDLQRLHGRLGRADRERLQLHIDSVAEVASRIDASSRVVCSAPERQDADEYPDVMDLQIDLIAEAFKCNLTRVASLQCSTGQSGIRHSWLGHTESHHGISHKGDSNAEARAQSAQIDFFYAQRFARLLGRLQDAEIPGHGTLLDHTTVVWVSEQSKGTGNSHTWDRMPYVIAGGDYFKQGRYIDCSGRAHGELFVNLMNMMGVEGNSFGIPDYCDGAIESLIA